jgi:AraC-like DNA-binding protein
MSFTYEDRESDSPFVENIWRTYTDSSGAYVAAADGRWDILIAKHGRSTSVLLGRPTIRATPILYSEGVEHIGIRFKLGTFLPRFPTFTTLTEGIYLPQATTHSFWLDGSTWPIPDFENADTFLARLVRADLLAHDPVVDAVLMGHEVYMSSRSVQRRFLRTTGLTQRYLQYIERAQLATKLLQRGVSVADVVFEAGYADQPHLTKALKHLIGQTPGQILHLDKTVVSIQDYPSGNH